MIGPAHFFTNAMLSGNMDSCATVPSAKETPVSMPLSDANEKIYRACPATRGDVDDLRRQLDVEIAKSAGLRDGISETNELAILGLVLGCLGFATGLAGLIVAVLS